MSGDRTYPREWFCVSAGYSPDIMAKTFIGETAHKLREPDERGAKRYTNKASDWRTWYPTREEAETALAEAIAMEAQKRRRERARNAAPELVEALREYENLMETGFTDRRNVERVRGMGQALIAKIEGAA